MVFPLALVVVAAVAAVVQPNMSTKIAVYKQSTIIRFWPSGNASIIVSVGFEKCNKMMEWDAIVHQWDAQLLADAHVRFAHARWDLNTEKFEHRETSVRGTKLLHQEIHTHGQTKGRD
jgi:hypothetical protein